MSNYNDLIANLQNKANLQLSAEEEKDRLKNLKLSMTEKDFDAQFNPIHDVFYSVEEDIKKGINSNKTLLLVESGLRGANDFKYFTGHNFSLHYNTNAIEDDPIFAELLIELPYALKSKASMLDGVALNDKKLILNYDFQNEKFKWIDHELHKEINKEDLKQFIVEVLNIKLLNSQNAF